MELEKIEKGDSRYKEGMRYKANFNGIILYFTEKALSELGCKIATLQNTSSNNEYTATSSTTPKSCPHCGGLPVPETGFNKQCPYCEKWF